MVQVLTPEDSLVLLNLCLEPYTHHDQPEERLRYISSLMTVIYPFLVFIDTILQFRFYDFISWFQMFPFLISSKHETENISLIYAVCYHISLMCYFDKGVSLPLYFYMIFFYCKAIFSINSLILAPRA